MTDSRTMKQRMLAGDLYHAADPELSAERRRARLLLHRLNVTEYADLEARAAILRDLFPNAGPRLEVEPPFHCDYGEHIHTGEGVYFNFGCVVLDVCRVTIGDRVLFGPGVQLLPATHPLDAAERATGMEGGRPISIGDDCWFGGGAIVLPGVTIGARAVIGAGAVVTRDVPSDVVVAGNPAKIIRQLD